MGIRIANSRNVYVEKAITVFCTCVRMAALEKLGV